MADILDVTALNRRLREVYSRAMPEIKSMSARYPNVSQPLLIHAPPTYAAADVRLMVVGQQTNGWGGGNNSLDGLLDTYSRFNLGQPVSHTPFWRAAHHLFKGLNPAGPERSFVWSNLVKVDVRNGKRHVRPPKELEEAVSQVNLLAKEIEILKPEVVVFFTGPRYDHRLRETLPGVEILPLSRELAILTHVRLPKASFRTYHPNYLHMSKKFGVLDSIISRSKW